MRWHRPGIVAATIVVACFEKPPRPGSGTSDAHSGDGIVTDAPPPDYNYAFVTSATLLPGELQTRGPGTPIENADALCNQLAGSAGLPGHYVAWLSSSNINALDRISSVLTGWVRRDLLTVAGDSGQLRGAMSTVPLFYPIDLDERGQRIAQQTDFESKTQVFTGTISGAWDTADDCGNYSSTTGQLTGGYADRGIRWSDAIQGLVDTPCVTPAHIYCFRIDGTLKAPSNSPVSGGRMVWISSSAYRPGGASTPNQTCQSDRASAVAILPTSSASADTIVGMNTLYRADNVVVGSLDSPQAPIDTTVFGTAAISVNYVWTGASSPTGAPSKSTDCNDWTGSAGSGYTGALDTTLSAWGGGPSSCALSFPVICAAP